MVGDTRHGECRVEVGNVYLMRYAQTFVYTLTLFEICSTVTESTTMLENMTWS
jgi:hypothetical protein